MFHSALCNCRDQLETSLDLIDQEGRGVLIYLSSAGSSCDDGEHQPSQPLSAQILLDLGLSSVRPLTYADGCVRQIFRPA